MSKYRNLFAQGTIGNLTISNRVIMPAMATVLCNADGSISSNQIAYYEERAKGGTGLIITEIMSVENKLGRAVSVQIRADEDRFIPGLCRLASTIHKYPTRVFGQLHHAGNQSNSRLTGGERIVSSSTVASGALGEQPRGLSAEEIRDLVNRFVAAAMRCKTAGFDGVELHGAHGYLINQFLSPRTNLRSDEYGGSIENRMRFVTEIIQGIKKNCGAHYPVMVRFSADEFVEGGINLEEGKQIARHLEHAGADALDVSCGTYESLHTVLEPITYDEGWRVYLAEAIKSEVEIPVAAVGVIRRPSFAEEVIAGNRADFVCIGRDTLSDPQWSNKSREGRDSEICQCISCLFCVESIFAGRPIECAVNARAGREHQITQLPCDGDGRTVAVIGGGPGGLEAARVLGLRGFTPIVYEKSRELGGALVPGCKSPGKESISWYTDYLKRQMDLLGVDVRLGVEATPELVEKEEPYAVIVAVGALPFVPKGIKGVPGPGVCSYLDVLWGRRTGSPETDVVVVGGGLTGCETAYLLSSQGARVKLVDKMIEIAANEHPINRIGIMTRLEEAGVDILTSRQLIQVVDGRVDLERLEIGEKEIFHANLVVIAMGLVAQESIVVPWLRRFERARVIGDAVEPRKVAQAVREGFDAAYVLEGGIRSRQELEEAPKPTRPKLKSRRQRQVHPHVDGA